MRKVVVILTVFVLLASQAQAQWVVTDPGLTSALYSQTAKQASEHIARLAEMIKTVKLLQAQVTDTQNILELAKESSRGIDGVEFVTDFRNVMVETGDLIQDVEGLIQVDSHIGEEWKEVFASLDPWIENVDGIFDSIDVSDKINSNGYLIADSYQKTYERNVNTARQFSNNAKQVNEKGALKQIAQELAHLIEMENHTMYLMSQMLKGQSVENSQSNLERKEEVVRFEKENEGVRRFIGMVDADTLGM